ncbi:MAG: hypothetical protein QXP01_08650, partial [Candidatus Hadarchaeum sp.]
MNTRSLRFLWTAILLVALATAAWPAPGAASPAPAPLSSGTSDDYGYTLSTGSYMGWIEAQGVNGVTQVNLTADDMFTGPHNLGFDFPFYENTYSQFYLSSNGLISFGSGSQEYQAKPIPFSPPPNNFIAPLWADLNKSQNGEVYIWQQNTTPKRTVIEWVFSGLEFEAVLYETGDIYFLYNNLDNLPEEYRIGIEDAHGVNGLAATSAPDKTNDFYFQRPVNSYRVKVYPRLQGGLLQNGQASFTVNVFNNGNYGADRYTLAATQPAGWQAFLYKPNGQLYSDTNGDGQVDSGLLAPGARAEVIVVVQAPAGATPPENAEITFTATSVGDSSKSMTATLQCALPFPFAQVYKDNYGVHLRQIWRSGVIDRRILDFYTGASFSMEAISKDNYLVAWENLTVVTTDGRTLSGVTPLSQGSLLYEGELLQVQTSRQYNDIYYTLVNRVQGAGPPRLLTNGASLAVGEIVEVNAKRPAIAVSLSESSNGNVALAWSLNQHKDTESGRTIQSNIMLTLLDAQGNPLTERFSVTGDEGWYTSDDKHIYENPTVSIIGDTLTVCWTQRFDGAIYCRRLSQSGTSFNPGSKILVASGDPESPPDALYATPLLSNDLLLVYSADAKIKYAILSSSDSVTTGTITPEGPEGEEGSQPRSLQFGDGDVLIAYISDDGRVAYTLDYGTNIAYLDPPGGRRPADLSLTLVP